LLERLDDARPTLGRLSISAAEHVLAAQRPEQHRLLDDERPSEMERIVRALVRPKIGLVRGEGVDHSQRGRGLAFIIAEKTSLG